MAIYKKEWIWLVLGKNTLQAVFIAIILVAMLRF